MVILILSPNSGLYGELQDSWAAQKSFHSCFIPLFILSPGKWHLADLVWASVSKEQGIALWLFGTISLLAVCHVSAFLSYTKWHPCWNHLFTTANQSFLAEGHMQNKPKLAAEPAVSTSRREQLSQKMLRGLVKEPPSCQINTYQIYLLFNYFSAHMAEGIQNSIGATCFLSSQI